MAMRNCLELSFWGNVDSNIGVGRGLRVFGTVVAIYLGGWLVAALGMYAASRRWNDRQSPAPNPLCVSVLAGAVWPLLIVGIVELSSGILYTKVQSERGPGVGILV